MSRLRRRLEGGSPEIGRGSIPREMNAICAHGQSKSLGVLANAHGACVVFRAIQQVDLPVSNECRWIAGVKCCRFQNYLGSGAHLVKRWSVLASRSEHRLIRPDGWVRRYAPELEKRVRWYQGYRATSWLVDETYVKVGGRWKYLFRAEIGKHPTNLAYFPRRGERLSCCGVPMAPYSRLTDLQERRQSRLLTALSNSRLGIRSWSEASSNTSSLQNS
jgi:hypothetical protein